MIRTLNVESDLQPTINLLDRLRAGTEYRAVRVDWQRVLGTLVAYSGMDRTGCVFVSEDKGEIQGVLIGVAQPLWWVNEAEGAMVASDLVFYVEHGRDGRRLCDAFVAWAFDTPRVIRVEMGVSTMPDMRAMDRVYRRCGLHKEGSLYVRNHQLYQSALERQK